LFTTVVEPAREWLDLLMHDLVCSNVAALGKGLAADVAVVRAFSRVSSLMGLEISAKIGMQHRAD
jgi:hypothetical protein